MRALRAIFLVTIATIAAAPIMATPEKVTDIQSEAADPLLINDKATELAEFLYAREDMAKDLEQTLGVVLPQSMKSASDFGVYEAEYPGLISAIVAALKPVMLKAYDDKMPLLWKSMSQIYREEFSPAELDQLIAFFKSPAGIRFTNSLKNNVNKQQFMDAAVSSGGELTDEVSGAVEKAKAQAIKKANMQMSSADKLAIFRFENSPLGPKMMVIGPLVQKALLEWDYTFTNEQKLEFVTIRQNTISAFIAKADAEKQALDAAPS
jgi:hypothetical protein